MLCVGALRSPLMILPQNTDDPPRTASKLDCMNQERPSFLLPVSTISFAVVVTLLWGWYGLNNGMPYETGLVYPSQLAAHGGPAALLGGFIYQGDPLRRFTSVFYHTAYLLSMMFSREGDFISYQIVWALLWSARGVLAGLICQRLFSTPAVISYLVGLFAVLHASDHALNWVGQLNQFGFIFWMLCAFYSYLRALAEPGDLRLSRVDGVA